jgi:hypothetical protein
LLDRNATGFYSVSPGCAAYLDPDKPTFIGDLFAYLNTRMYDTWGLLTPALRTGKPQGGPSRAGGFTGFYGDPPTAEIFLKGMSGGSRLAGRALAERFPWREYTTFLDIGTAQGCVLVEIARAHPHLTGGGFDLPALASAFTRYVRDHGLTGRLSFHAGDFFHDALPQADVLIMGRVLHDWEAATRRQLLGKAYAALPRNGALIVYDALIDEARRTNAHALLASLNMLLQTDGGSEYTPRECVEWMQEAGFTHTRSMPLTGMQTAVVGIKGRMPEWLSA